MNIFIDKKFYKNPLCYGEQVLESYNVILLHNTTHHYWQSNNTISISTLHLHEYWEAGAGLLNIDGGRKDDWGDLEMVSADK